MEGSPLDAWSILPQACTLLLMVLFIYDVFFVFITPFLTKVGPAPARAPPLPAPTPRPCPSLPTPCPLVGLLHSAPPDMAPPFS